MGPINCAVERSCVRRRVCSRVWRSCEQSSAGAAPLVGRSMRSGCMKIILITPARSSSRSGNATTSSRWARILRKLGHRVYVTTKYNDARADLMIALHAWRSAESIRRFRELYPEPPLHSLACADRLIALQELARKRVPRRFRHKVRVIYQSAAALAGTHAAAL